MEFIILKSGCGKIKRLQRKVKTGYAVHGNLEN